MPLTLEQLNAASPAEALSLLDGLYEHSPWIAEEALAQIKARRYYEPYLTDPRPLVLLGAGGFTERAIRCLWKEVAR